ncbi:pilus assembly protein [Bradyrhizobium sp. WSM 1738]|uniref:TadE/TadG family type IV pilus assembly protein n=1 Tax=Bradyrhizobium hereditatis TaxID=2821405 RepID=UPI001CE33922|nr:TadE/TadG family type IV pilus assembly protein [Bradyrhizobium hereditatis]MCA6115280.1 pilus assembly protein [Bradyrhizobium hereditatis]
MPSSTWLLRLRHHVAALRSNCSGLAAVEFAMIIPLMAMMFLGTYEFSAGVAIDRKVTIMARTLSDLTSQNTEVDDAKFTNFFNASAAIMTPYPSAPVESTISELWINPSTLQARVQWSKGAYARSPTSVVEIPDALKIGDTYLIYSEVKYKYVPTVAWFINKVSGITLSDVSFTRPRQGICVMYKTTTCEKK